MHRTAIGALLVALVSTSALADTLRLDQDSFSVGNGGSFQVTPVTGNAGRVGLPGDLSPTTFETFCVEHNEQFRPGAIYNFAISLGATNGGESGQTSPNFDPVDPTTAYLYTNFRMGTLTGFDYGAGRAASTGDLQQAIWFLEGEGGTNNAFVALAQGAVTSGAWAGIGNVRVLNLSNQEFSFAQDQLTLVQEIPAPMSGAALALLAFGGRRRSR